MFFLDFPDFFSFGLQDFGTFYCWGLFFLNDLLLVLLFFISFFVFSFLLLSLFSFFGFRFSNPTFFVFVFNWSFFNIYYYYFNLFLFFYLDYFFSFSLGSSLLLEIIWTSFPIIFLLFLFFPSLFLIILGDQFVEVCWGLKIIAHQWYWTYEYYNGFIFDSYCLNSVSLGVCDFLLLDCDNPLVIPLGLPGRVLITSYDVIHSWGVPSLGLKLDAVPGRLNQLFLNVNRLGFYYGQCYELCGTNHSFMPISIEVLFWSDFLDWLAFSSV